MALTIRWDHAKEATVALVEIISSWAINPLSHDPIAPMLSRIASAAIHNSSAWSVSAVFPVSSEVVFSSEAPADTSEGDSVRIPLYSDIAIAAPVSTVQVGVTAADSAAPAILWAIIIVVLLVSRLVKVHPDGRVTFVPDPLFDSFRRIRLCSRGVLS